MKTSLALIEQAVERELENPTGEVKTHYVAGFPVDNVTVPPRGFDDRRRSFREDSARLRERLAASGVQPIAVLPAQWWHAMVDRAGLLDLAPDDQGRVQLNADRVAKRALKGAGPFMSLVATSTILLSALCYYAFVFRHGLTPYHLGRAVVIVGGSVAFSAAFFAFIVTATPLGAYVTAGWSSLYYMLTHRRVNVVRQMLEDGKSRGGRLVQVYLPKPPEEVTAVLKKCVGQRLRVAAVPGAVGFSKSPGRLIYESLRDERQEEYRRQREMRQLDPIVYAESGSAVAIIAQFGAFPIEQKLVEEVVKSGSLLG
jgi:hypothetical protein